MQIYVADTVYSKDYLIFLFKLGALTNKLLHGNCLNRLVFANVIWATQQTQEDQSIP